MVFVRQADVRIMASHAVRGSLTITVSNVKTLNTFPSFAGIL